MRVAFGVVTHRERFKEQRPYLAVRRGRGQRMPHTVGVEFLDMHLIKGERAGLVGTNVSHRTERLDGRETPHQRVVRRHASRAEGQRHGDDRGQGLGNRSDRETDGDE